ncbi:hypothetical protein ACS0TY_025776 [Phlomoides rotata]
MSPSQTTDDVTILEIREASPTHFLMKVESFSLLGKNGIHKYESGEFTAGEHKWRLILYPNEDKTGIDSRYISVGLAISDTASQEPANWEVNALFSISLLNQITGNYHYSGRTQRFQAMKSEWGISKFISKEILMDQSNGFLVKGNCVFGAEVFIVERLAVSECLSVKNVTVPYKHDWKISDFSQLGRCWTSDKFVVVDLNWEVSLYPKGENHEKGRCQAIGIFLGTVDSKRVNACFSICIKDQVNDEHEKETADSHWFSSTSDDCRDSWGWPRFMELGTLEDPKNGFIMNDCCLLELEISVKAVV